MKLSICTVGLLACAVGCASTPPPTAKVASTQTAVQSARAEGAAGVPDAQPYLTKAEDQLGKAHGLMKKGDNDEAAALLTRAEADAQLATALTHEAKQNAATIAAEQRLRTMSPTLEPTSR